MERKNVSRQYLIEKATKIINAPYTAIDEEFYQSTEWRKTKSGYALYSTKYHMLCFTAYEHFSWHGRTIYGLFH
jgi:hypothetical protein